MSECTTCGGASKTHQQLTLDQAKRQKEDEGRSWARKQGLSGFYLCLRINRTGYLYRDQQPDNLEWEYISLR